MMSLSLPIDLDITQFLVQRYRLPQLQSSHQDILIAVFLRNINTPPFSSDFIRFIGW